MSTTFIPINIGKFPNDAEGDSLRTAFTKVNENFNQVFGALETVNQAGQLRSLPDVDASNLNDGAVVVYDKGADKFLTQTLLEKQIINGGHF